MPARRGLTTPRAIAAAALLAGGAFAAGILEGGAGADGLRLAARYTARVAFLGFLPAYLASSWNTLWPSAASRLAVERRRSLGLAFATLHSVHLVALVGYQRASAQVPDLAGLVVGGGAYAILFAMVATSNDRAVRRMGVERWRLLHRVGIHWLWFVFAFTYAGRVAGGNLAVAPLLVTALLALGVRRAAARHRRGVQSTAGAPARGFQARIPR